MWLLAVIEMLKMLRCGCDAVEQAAADMKLCCSMEWQLNFHAAMSCINTGNGNCQPKSVAVVWMMNLCRKHV
jgi:hypothetical protein